VGRSPELLSDFKRCPLALPAITLIVIVIVNVPTILYYISARRCVKCEIGASIEPVEIVKLNLTMIYFMTNH